MPAMTTLLLWETTQQRTLPISSCWPPMTMWVGGVDVKAELDTLGSQLKDLQTSVGGLTNSVEALEVRAGTLETSLGALTSRVSTLEVEVAKKPKIETFKSAPYTDRDKGTVSCPPGSVMIACGAGQGHKSQDLVRVNFVGDTTCECVHHNGDPGSPGNFCTVRCVTGLF